MSFLEEALHFGDTTKHLTMVTSFSLTILWGYSYYLYFVHRKVRLSKFKKCTLSGWGRIQIGFFMATMSLTLISLLGKNSLTTWTSIPNLPCLYCISAYKGELEWLMECPGIGRQVGRWSPEMLSKFLSIVWWKE